MSQGMAKKLKKKKQNYWLKKIFFKMKNASSVAKGDVTRFDTQLWSQRLSVLSLTVVSLSHRVCPAGDRRGVRAAGSMGQRAECTQMPFLSLLRYRTSG